MKNNVSLISILLACTATSILAQEDYSTWDHTKQITINTTASGANVAGDNVNFPLLVRLTSAQADIFARAKTGGADMRFLRLPGPTRSRRIPREYPCHSKTRRL